MAEARDYLIGIDAGTSIIKVALFDRAGRQRAAVGTRNAPSSPWPGWSEVDMEASWRAVAGSIRAVLDQAGLDGTAVAAVGVSGAMVGAWIVDAAGRPVRPAILWNDGRTQDLIDRMQAADPAFFQRIFASSGSVMQQGCTLPVVRWLLDHEPDIMARAAHVLGCKDWLRFRLTGRIAADPTEAAVAPGSARDRGRSAAMLALFGLDGQRHLFPDPAPSESLAGTVQPDAAAATGLAAGTPVAIGAGDVPASVLGAGAVEPGTACTILGTNCLNGLVVAAPSFAPPDVGLLFTVPGGTWLRTMVNVAGTTNLDWFIERLCPDLHGAAGAPPFETLEAMAEASGPGARGLLYHPYLSELGIIAPVVSGGARGQFFGLAQQHDRADLLRAVYEGVCHSVRDCYAAIDAEIEEVRLCGGGARSAFWSQMMADVLGRAVAVPDGPEFGAKGAALLAATAIGWFPDIAAAVRATDRILRRHRPDPSRHAVYDEGFARYQAHRDAMIAAVRADGTRWLMKA